MKPAIILTQQFKGSSHKQVGKYIDYINREEAKRNHYFETYNFITDIGQDNYVSYMGQPEKTTGLFTDTKSQLTVEDKDQLQHSFEKAKANGSVLWQTVFSFDNQFLIDQQLYNDKTGQLNEPLIQHATRQAVQRLKDKEQFNDTLVWAAAIHYNTDNIHVHIGLMEEIPSRKKMLYHGKWVYRGKMKQSSLDTMKSTFIHQLLDRSVHLAKLQQLAREKLSRHIFKTDKLFEDAVIVERLKRLYNDLPTDKRLWKYHMSVMTPFHNTLNRLTFDLIQTYDSKAYNDYVRALDEENAFYERLYGTGTKEYMRYAEYKENKLNELYARTGNMILQQLKHMPLMESIDNNRVLDNHSSRLSHDVNQMVRGLVSQTQDYLSQRLFEKEKAIKEWQRQQQHKGRTF